MSRSFIIAALLAVVCLSSPLSALAGSWDGMGLPEPDHDTRNYSTTWDGMGMPEPDLDTNS